MQKHVYVFYDSKSYGNLGKEGGDEKREKLVEKWDISARKKNKQRVDVFI